MLPHAPGLGELLRHLLELVDRGSQAHYLSVGVEYRPRFTPVMRVLCDQPLTVAELQSKLQVTQGAVSQTIKLMEKCDLIIRHDTNDGRSKKIALSPAGQKLADALKVQWELRFSVISELETEIGYPLREITQAAIAALEEKGFCKRLQTLNQARELVE